jgi:hypothetical protein
MSKNHHPDRVLFFVATALWAVRTRLTETRLHHGISRNELPE